MNSEVTQADRDAAIAVITNKHIAWDDVDAWSIAFARHRIAAEQAAAERERELVKVLGQARKDYKAAYEWVPDGYYGQAARSSEMAEYWEKRFDKVEAAFEDFCDRIDALLAKYGEQDD